MCQNGITIDIEELNHWIGTFNIVLKSKINTLNTMLLIEYMINMLIRSLNCKCNTKKTGA